VVPLDVAEQYARLLPDARLERVADAGHLVELEQPARVAEWIVAHRKKALRRSGG
jgi:pimeloyl-ACP methyl ester carboxylesterase